ncbi:MAG: DUF29 domain-containing protein [Cyanobacteria bacterium J06635_1]
MPLSRPTPQLTQYSQSYEQDYVLWLDTTAALLRQGNLAAIDLENLLEELESMGRSEKRALESNLVVVLQHLLKYKYQPDKRTKSWLLSIAEHRRRLRNDLEASPSLKRYLNSVFEKCYRDACKQASIETEQPLSVFPEASLFTADETLDEDCLPGEVF